MPMQSRELSMPFYMPLRPDGTFTTWRLKAIRSSADVRSASRETRLALKVNPDQMGAEHRLAAAVKLYELGRISSGAAATLAGVREPCF